MVDEYRLSLDEKYPPDAKTHALREMPARLITPSAGSNLWRLGYGISLSLCRDNLSRSVSGAASEGASGCRHCPSVHQGFPTHCMPWTRPPKTLHHPLHHPHDCLAKPLNPKPQTRRRASEPGSLFPKATGSLFQIPGFGPAPSTRHSALSVETLLHSALSIETPSTLHSALSIETRLHSALSIETSRFPTQTLMRKEDQHSPSLISQNVFMN